MAECSPFGTYGFQHVAFSIDGTLVTAFDDGDDCISITPTSDISSSKVGADGASVTSISADQSATVTIRLLPNSPHNAYLRNKVARMRNGALDGARFPIGFTDLTSRESGGCTNAVIQAYPPDTRGVMANSLEWTFFCPCWSASTVAVTNPA
jgi:hypothetical protein